MDRKEFLKQSSSLLLTYAFLESIFTADALDRKAAPLGRHWLARLDEMCRDLKSSKLSPRLWQEQTELLFREISLEDLLRFTDFDRLTAHFVFPDLGVNTKNIRFPKLDGLPERTVFIKKLFGMQAGRAVIPHGHSNMASAHLVLKGRLHLRHYDKIREENDRLIVRPKTDRIARPGDCSSVSDDSANVHWMVAQSPAVFMMDVIVLDLNEKAYDIHNLDMEAAQPAGNGLLIAPKMEVGPALAKYGKTHH